MTAAAGARFLRLGAVMTASVLALCAGPGSAHNQCDERNGHV